MPVKVWEPLLYLTGPGGNPLHSPMSCPWSIPWRQYRQIMFQVETTIPKKWPPAPIYKKWVHLSSWQDPETIWKDRQIRQGHFVSQPTPQLVLAQPELILTFCAIVDKKVNAENFPRCSDHPQRQSIIVPAESGFFSSAVSVLMAPIMPCCYSWPRCHFSFW